jgi:hypothetical protein
MLDISSRLIAPVIQPALSDAARGAPFVAIAQPNAPRYGCISATVSFSGDTNRGVAAPSLGRLENLPTAPSLGAKTDLIWNVMRLSMRWAHHSTPPDKGCPVCTKRIESTRALDRSAVIGKCPNSRDRSAVKAFFVSGNLSLDGARRGPERAGIDAVRIEPQHLIV